MSGTPNNDQSKGSGRRKVRGFVRFVFKWTLVLIVFLAMATGVGVIFGYHYLNEDLPRITTLADYRPPVITTVYSDDGRKISEFYKERRILTPLSEMPQQLVNAFIAAEDSRFYQHQGVDLLSIVRAFFKNLEAGTIVQGGSTITQQVTKSFLLTPERSYIRKIKEAILAYRIDKAFTKEEILYLYLNQIYLGNGAYGVAAAAENYFAKSVSDLTLAECAMLAGLPQAPSRYSPIHRPELAKQRQIYVLNRMVAEGYITNIQATEAINAKLDIKSRRNWYIEEVPEYTEYIRRELENLYGAEALYTEGLKVYTAVNIELQRAARKDIEKGLRDLDKRQGYRGPEQHLAPEEMEAFSAKLQAELDEQPLVEGRIIKALVVDVDDAGGQVTARLGGEIGVIPFKTMRWARKPDPDVAYYQASLRRPSEALSVGDVIFVKILGKKPEGDTWELDLEQTPIAQAALLSLETGTGNVKVMVGGRDFRKSQFNRAIQARRQPGSAFKPIIYAAALDKGYTPASVVIDSPIVFKDTERDFVWKPRNYKKHFYGPTLFRQALAKSRNVVTIKILREIGVSYAVDYAHRLGIESALEPNLSLALGSSGVSVLELVTAYSVFANQGYRVPPVFITRILDRDGNVLYEPATGREKVIEESTAYIMTSLLESVVKSGTGWRVRALKRPVAGKTGTTNDLFDAWFVGYTPQYVTGVWVGFDEEARLGEGETGSRAASPIWLAFMQEAHKDLPVKDFKVPEGVVFSKIDADTGLLPIPESEKTIFECFKEGTVPTEYTKRPDSVTEPEDFYKSVM
ncbi:MAG: penicillin-binding protein 1A [Desulfobacteraceae bacterium]|nr:penicillin-binding protein 1A [Desulfobacteraceae bacterium]